MIVDTSSLPVTLRGVVWSGFDTGTMLDGLQAGPKIGICLRSPGAWTCEHCRHTHCSYLVTGYLM